MLVLKESSTVVSKVVAVLRRGGIVVCPTDTVYGFLADATNKKAVSKIYKIKHRPRSKPLPVFVKDLRMAYKLAEIDEKQAKILKKFWPGKYTFILRRKGGVKLFGVAKDTIAVRVSNYKFLNDLLTKMNKPLAQTSVNISTRPPLLKIEDIKNQFGKNKLIELIVDGGNLKKSRPSKIMDLTTRHLTKIR